LRRVESNENKHPLKKDIFTEDESLTHTHTHKEGRAGRQIDEG